MHSLLNNALVGALTGGLFVYWLTTYGERKKQKLYIFKTLMATRAVPLSPEHVGALNRIDFEFYNNEEVTNSWNLYLDHLNRIADANWENRRQELFVELLFAMGKSLGYKFDKVRLRNSMYSPVAHGEWQADSVAIQKGLLSIIRGESEILVKLSQNSQELKK